MSEIVAIAHVNVHNKIQLQERKGNAEHFADPVIESGGPASL